ncbi:methylenetetrahydrofolate--tRNA-(uracil(54)-C(5))-methyltransferase (FADH(2)-oxidizing) TrmFO [Spiroplasma eriocheiris]|uniref:Methylenetetrahydrofolate--tRNA-(uracil-5-)-methyltransferase TrmFO n=1 Tax=Spiroplasma eriocheiris TaxID=315358 RepID=A0A0H3XKA2_9MOLU|nr:methylenetetrahydrofolate--tRNA-(uracil(54)-C(5))-methyltransferase (FADH(2)-oxidizing) TrmFO [Spiroplasma eriocheiris]AHF57347.1 tRNA (uracil-5-)-methyltransferase [Spiroplasma eriocheiris CCTCC M 207170]AKM53804.1 tRNA (uracil-5-)-methyltransferase Gid [Spiroplasma eriocheiris]
MKNKKINVVGAGLAGCEIAYQLAKRGLSVNLYEVKQVKKNPVQNLDSFAELVCSNSFRSKSVENASGILKEELKMLDSLIIKAALASAISADDALAVDRQLFSNYVTQQLGNNPNITIHHTEFETINPRDITIIASGPLTTEKLQQELTKIIGKKALYFYDASAPIITKENIDFTKVYYQALHSAAKDYLVCPLSEHEFNLLHQELVNASTVALKEFEKYFKGCQPIEVLAKQSKKLLLNGPMSPNYLQDDHGNLPYAVVQLRKDNLIDTLYNIVGWQTNLTWPEQKRIINNFIPGLAKVDIVRYGVLHKNNYINSPKLLNQSLQLKQNPNIFFAGQITGVEGYLESTASGLYCALNVYQYYHHQKPLLFPPTTVLGSLMNYVTNPRQKNLKPMKANIGIIPVLGQSYDSKKAKNLAIYDRAMQALATLISDNNILNPSC